MTQSLQYGKLEGTLDPIHSKLVSTLSFFTSALSKWNSSLHNAWKSLYMSAFSENEEDSDFEDDFSEGFETLDDIEDLDQALDDELNLEDHEDDEDAELDIQEERFFDEGDMDDVEDEEEDDDEDDEDDSDLIEDLNEFVDEDLIESDEDYYYGEYEE